MKIALLFALALAATGVTLVATADEAAACVPPNCPGFGRCVVTTDTLYVEDVEVRHPTGIKCYY